MRRRGIFLGIELRDLFLYGLAFFVAFWTARAALARGRSPWVWGGASLVFGFVLPLFDSLEQLRILGVAPVLFLMFFVRQTEQRGQRPGHSYREGNACPKCASPHSPGQNFCTKCGWDLAHEYTPESGDTVLASEMRQPQGTSAATMERPAEAAAETSADSAPESAESAPEPAASPASGDWVGADAVEPPVAEPEPEPQRPWGIPQPGPAPTAEVMTARGAMLLSEGKLQEAIDQFTKAIALDPKHREAFERRAEAYTQQGRGERAAEDYQRIQALNAGS